MKKIILLSILNGLFFQVSNAQGPTYNWGKKLNHNVIRMETDSLGNIYTVGNVYDSVNVAIASNPAKMLYGTPGYASVFISKYKPNGDLIWGTILKSTTDVNVSTLSISPNGKTVAISGSFDGTLQGNANVPNRTSQGFRDAFLARYNDSGDLKAFGSAGGTGSDYALGTHYDKQGHLYFMYFFFQNNTHYVNIVKYNKVIGQPVLWQFNVQSTQTVSTHGIGVDKNNNVYFMASHYRNLVYLNAAGNATQSTADAYIALTVLKLTSDGKFNASTQIKTNYTNFSTVGLVVNQNGDVYATGGFKHEYGPVFLGSNNGDTISSLKSTNSFIVKYNTNLAFQWVRQQASNVYNSIQTIKLDRDENIYITGEVNDITNIMAHNKTTNIGENGKKLAYLIKYSQGGNVIFHQTYDVGVSGLLANVCFSPSNEIYLQGISSNNTMDMNPGTAEDLLTKDGNEIMFLTKQSQENVVSNAEINKENKSLLVYPNPSNGTIFFKEAQIGEQIIITDLFGKVVLEHLFQTPSQNLDLTSLSNGMYILSFKNLNNEILSTKIIINQ